MEIPASLLMSSGLHAYVAVKASLHASDSAVFGLNDDEIVALVKRFENYKKEVINGILLKASPIVVINALGQLGYKVVATTGEAEIASGKFVVMCECGAHSAAGEGVSQSLAEMEFERGLWFAAQYGDLERAQQLLNKGHNVDERDSAGYTALHYAARNGHTTLCRFLLDRGACVNAVTCNGKATPLHRAASVGKLEIVKLLVEKGANYCLKDSDGRTALHRAAIGDFPDVCRYLLGLKPALQEQIDNRGNKAEDYVKSNDLALIFNQSPT